MEARHPMSIDTAPRPPKAPRNVGVAEPLYIAGWWARFFASAIDSVIIVVGVVVLVAAATALNTGAAMAVAVIGALAVLFLYQSLMLARNNGQTLGKKWLGVRVVNGDGSPIGFGRAFVREFVLKSLPSALSPFNLIDYLWAAFREDKRSLHDLGA